MPQRRGEDAEPGRWWEHPFMRELEEEQRRDAELAKENDVHCKRREQVEWAAERDLNVGAHVTPSQLSGLKDWFRDVDADSSGTVSLLELADPLLTTGVAESVAECVEIFRAIDEDGSGEIDFDEFIEMVTIKSSGKLARMREQWQRQAGQKPRLIDERQRRAEAEAAKADGILAICEALKNDEHATMTLTSAVVFERRKFISRAVMKQASRYRVRFTKEQFMAIREILFSSPDERKAAFQHAGRKEDDRPRPRRAPAPHLFRTHKLPWQHRRSESKQGDATEDDDRVGDDACDHFQSWPGKSQVLPKLQQRPLLNRKRASVGLRARVSTPALDDQEELYLLLERKRRAGRIDVVADRGLQGSNVRLHRVATDRTMLRMDMMPFPEWLRSYGARDEDLQDSSVATD